MNAHIIFGLFALYVATISLWLVLVGRQDALLALLRGVWGRTLGYALYFITRVALPILVCILCLGWGIRHYDAAAFRHVAMPLRLNVEYYRDLNSMLQSDKSMDSLGVVYGA